MSRVAAVVLAAGASQRMGQPKAHLQWRGRSFLELACGLAQQGGCAPIVVVAGACALTPPNGAQLVENPRWRQGQLSSLQLGLRAALAAQPEVAGVAVLTVDRPRIRARTVQNLLTAFAAHSQSIWQPSVGSRSGHPIVFPREACAGLLELPPTASARELVRSEAWAGRRRQLEVDDPGVIENVDTPEDYARLDD